MPAHLIVAARSSGGAGRSASHAIAHAASAQDVAPLLLEVRTDGSDRPGLAGHVVTGADEAAELIAGQKLYVAISYLEQPSEEVLRGLLPLAATVTVVGDRTGNLDHAVDVYEMVTGLGIVGASGRVLLPWLLPSGWPCNKDPGTRLRGWEAQLRRRTFPDRLRCLPLVFPWSDFSTQMRASKERVEAIGASLLQHLTTIAGGRAPDRPSEGLAGGDPWPDLPAPASVVHLFRNRPGLSLPHGA